MLQSGWWCDFLVAGDFFNKVLVLQFRFIESSPSWLFWNVALPRSFNGDRSVIEFSLRFGRFSPWWNQREWMRCKTEFFQQSSCFNISIDEIPEQFRSRMGAVSAASVATSIEFWKQFSPELLLLLLLFLIEFLLGRILLISARRTSALLLQLWENVNEDDRQQSK